jgi:hypothetical protein
MENDNVVYWLGAGASYNAIPVVRGMGARLYEFLNYFSSNNFVSVIYNKLNIKKIDEKWFDYVIEINESYSIDTLVRKYYLSEQFDKANELKKLLCSYLLWEQIIKPNSNSTPDLIQRNIDKEALNVFHEYPANLLKNNYPTDYAIGYTNRFNYSSNKGEQFDKPYDGHSTTLRNLDFRYESLLSAIASKRYKINDRFSFISWNYDSQIEIALNKLFSDGSKNEELSKENITTREIEKIIKSKLIKLNGSIDHSDLFFENMSKLHSSNKISELNKIYEFLCGSAEMKHSIRFAWDPQQKEVLRKAKDLLRNAKYVIICGYSFPEYNREIDKELIQSMTIGLNKRIIVQDTLANIEMVVSRIKSIKPNISIDKYTDLNQFFIPL